MTATTSVATRPNPTAARTAHDLVLLLARIGLAVLMLAHALLALDYAGGSIAGVGQLFAKGGVPLPELTGPANVLLETVGSVALALGLAVRPISVLMALNMVGAWVLVHPGALYAEDRSGPELVIALGLLSLVLAATGSGRFGLDQLIRTKRSHR